MKHNKAYHYTECGLDYVYLLNGVKFHDTDYGKGTSIHDIDGLHKAIGNRITQAPVCLRGQEVRFLRYEMDLSQRSLAELMGLEEQAIRRWESKKNTAIPSYADRLLRAIYLDKFDDLFKFGDLIRELAMLDRKDISRLDFEENNGGWQTAA